MTGYDTVVRGGTLATTEGGVRGDLAVAGGRVAALGLDLDTAGAQVIDASGLIVAPGAIDVHTHFANKVGAEFTADDYESGSRAAALGGITTFVNFAFQEPGRSLGEAVDEELSRAKGRSLLDFGLHVVVTDLSVGGLLDELPKLADRGCTTLKIFTAVGGVALGASDVLRVLAAAAQHGLMVDVHAEDGPLVDHLTSRLLEAGKRSVGHLPAARPPESEALATANVAAYAQAVGCGLYIVHLSCRAALDAVREARRRGAEIFVETRPAYLYLDADRYTLPDREGNKFVCWPPLRTGDDQAALWEGLRNGEIQTYATDHTTWSAAQKTDPSLSFDDIPGGISNVQTSIGMLYAEGVGKGRISLSRFVQVTASNPARLFGLWPRKGTLAVGADADLVLIDPGRRFRVSAPLMASRSDFDPYEGFEVVGWPALTMARGEVLVREGEVLGRPGRGRFLVRGRREWEPFA